jgi:hypothetical protein
MGCKSILASCATILISLAACRDGTGPTLPSKLLVTNTTCASGPCATLDVLAFPSVPDQPITPAGPWSLDLGTVTGESACLTIPASATFTVTDAGTGAKTVTRWTTANRLSIGLVTPGQTRFQSGPSTGTFVPARAAAWRVDLPGTATPVPAIDCQ